MLTLPLPGGGVEGFYIFWDILNKRKGNLGEECVKRGFYPFRAKLEQLPLISLENDSFQFWTYFSTCPSLKSGFPIHNHLSKE